MGALRTLGHVTAKSFTTPAYYADILKVSLWFSLKFYLVFWFAFSLATCLVVVPRVLTVVNNAITVIPAELVKLYPAELEITINNGRVSTNVVEPYYYPFSNFEDIMQNISDRILGATTANYDYLFVIDTQASIDTFENLNSYALLTADHFVYYNDKGNVEIVSLKNIADFTLNRQIIDSFINKIQPYLLYIPSLVGALIVIGIFLFIAWSQLIYIMLFTCLTWLIAQLISMKLTYMKSFQLTVHLFIVITTILGVLSLLKISPEIPFFRTGLMLLTMTGILLKIKELVVPTLALPDNGHQ